MKFYEPCKIQQAKFRFDTLREIGRTVKVEAVSEV